MVEVRYRGTLGDNLFQYCFGRLLAERWGYELAALPVPRFPGTAERVEGRRFLSPFQSWSGSAVEERQLGMLLRGRELAEPVPGRLVLYGWFQRWEYYRDHMDTIRRWLKVEPPDDPAQEDDLAICLRTRRPEAWSEPGIHAGQPPAWRVPLPAVDHIARLAGKVPHSRLLLFTDAPHAPAVQALSSLRPVVMNIDSFAAWNRIRSCRRIALSICHPGDWWAAMLSGAAEIYAVDPWPARKRNHCSGPYGCGWRGGRPLARPDLHVNDPRWIYEW